MRSEDDLEPHWKRWFRYTIMGLILGAAALAAAASGVDHQQSIHCRSKSDPSVYGVEFCIPPVTKPSAKSRG